MVLYNKTVITEETLISPFQTVISFNIHSIYFFIHCSKHFHPLIFVKQLPLIFIRLPKFCHTAPHPFIVFMRNEQRNGPAVSSNAISATILHFLLSFAILARIKLIKIEHRSLYKYFNNVWEVLIWILNWSKRGLREISPSRQQLVSKRNIRAWINDRSSSADVRRSTSEDRLDGIREAS